jgi:glycosyltransferase involved in cell wall biosynthesis
MTTFSLVQDPVNKGGIATVVKWYEEWMTVHGRSRRTYYLDDAERGGIGRLVRWDPSIAAVPRVLPRMHLPMYTAARYRMRGIWDDADEIHVIGASSLHGSLAPANVPSLVWLGPLIADERSSSLHFQSRARRLLYRATLGPLSRIEATVLSRASRVMAQSPHTADLIVRQGLASANRVEVRTVPIDTGVFAPPENDPRRTGLLFVGRTHDPRKGFSRIAALLEASPRARAAGVDVVSPVATDATDGVRWRGRVEDLPDLYGKAALLVLPSIQEGLGIVAFEALACGTPVVAYRCGGPDQLLAESGAAILVDDDRAFRSAVEELLADDVARAEMGAVGRRYVVDAFSVQNFLADTSLFTVNN